MGRHSCFVKDCTTGYNKTKFLNKSKGIRNPTLFRVKDEETLHKWQEVIPKNKKDCLFSKADAICELHFSEIDIERNYETRLPDGTISIIPRSLPTLKFGAIPSIFTDYVSVETGPALSEQGHVLSDTTCKDELMKSPEFHKKVSNTFNNVDTTPKDESMRSPEAHEEAVSNTFNDGDTNNNHSITENDSNLPQNSVDDNEVSENNVIDNNLFISEVKQLKLFSPYWYLNASHNMVMWTCWSTDYSSLQKRILLHRDKTIQIFIKEKEVKLSNLDRVETVADVQQMLKKVASLIPCQGPEMNLKIPQCMGYIMPGKYSTRNIRCVACNKYRHRSRQNLKNAKRKQGNKRLWKRIKNTKKINFRMKQQVLKLKRKIQILKDQCANIKMEAIKEALAELPDNQKLAVETCLKMAKLKSAKGMRYTQHWILQCILIRIKSFKTYEHLRHNRILPLPTIKTLNRYMKEMKGSYGFQDQIFKLLKAKTADMDSREKRGMLLIDEMKLAKGVSFNQKNLQFEGFVNLGKYTPLHDQNKRGDHALVLMFQPFQGKWVQAIACFLSKGCASSTILHQIIIEAIILLENAGLFVDGVTTDGASWNRSMWTLFGITENEVSCSHMMDSSRRLWFISDFPHLIKCVRNFFTSREENWTPDGVIKLKHWDALLEVENEKGFNLKANYKLTSDHVRPKEFQKMNVAMAFQFFGVSDAMNLYKNEHPDLHDSDGTQKFCKRIKNLIEVMNVRTPKGSLTLESEGCKIIEDFLVYIKNWEQEAKKQNYFFLSQSTCEGLKVSLKGTLEMCKFLISECGFIYIMTARLNQDALERFFGIARNFCGQNDHPDPTLFIQMYNLITTYSLVKPPKGSNVQSDEVLAVLFDITDIENQEERKKQWEAQLDAILQKGTNMHILSEAISIVEDQNYFENEEHCSDKVTHDHQYQMQTTSDYIITYMAGFIARKCNNFVQFRDATTNELVLCQDCLHSLKLSSEEDIPESHKWISIKSRGHLIHPSHTLSALISALEKSVLKVLSTQKLSKDTLYDITSCLAESENLPFVGCSQHYVVLTQHVMKYYLIMRMHFISKQFNKNESIEQKKTKRKRKFAKLCTVKDGVEESVNETAQQKTGKQTGKQKTVTQKTVKQKAVTQKTVKQKAVTQKTGRQRTSVKENVTPNELNIDKPTRKRKTDSYKNGCAKRKKTSS